MAVWAFAPIAVATHRRVENSAQSVQDSSHSRAHVTHATSLRMSVPLGSSKLSYPLLYEFEFRGMVRHAAGALERVDRRTSLASPGEKLG